MQTGPQQPVLLLPHLYCMTGRKLRHESFRFLLIDPSVRNHGMCLRKGKKARGAQVRNSVMWNFGENIFSPKAVEIGKREGTYSIHQYKRLKVV